MQALIQRLRVPAVAVALQAALLMAQVQQSPPKGNRTISGTVVNSVTGDPIRRALVDIGGQHSALTDGDGHFEFHDLPDSQVFINVHKPGFFNEQEISSAPPPENLLVQAETDPKAVIAKLVPEGVVFGRIGSESGPVEGQQVSLVASRVRDGVRRWERHGNATTDEEGTFRIAELMPGSYYLSVGPGTKTCLLPELHRGFMAMPNRFIPEFPNSVLQLPLKSAPVSRWKQILLSSRSPCSRSQERYRVLIPEPASACNSKLARGNLSLLPCALMTAREISVRRFQSVLTF